MKVSTPDKHVIGSSGLQAPSAFKIRNNAHAFKILSSGLYSDKVAAVLREIGCNAMDAHIEVGTPSRPFEVKLPNRIDNQFYIKDWGPGLSHDDVTNLYTTYFESTKQHSNDFTGAFGLGSKSPFSYTDSFVVTSSHGGKVRTYTAHLDDSGTPTIAKLTEVAATADWPHGVIVSFPVKPNDYVQFQERAKQIFQWFKVVPKVEGAGQVMAAEYSFDSPEFSKVKDSAATPLVLMGNVAYPLSMDKLGSATKTSVLAQYVSHFKGIVLRVPIGAVQVAASREELQYDKGSAKELAARAEAAMMHVARSTAELLDKFQTADWAGKCEMVKAKIAWQGNDHSYGFSWEGLFKAAGFPKAEAYAKLFQSRSLPLPAYAGATSSFRLLDQGPKRVNHTLVIGGKSTGKDPYSVSLPLAPATAIYYGKAPHPLARARQAVADRKADRLILISPHHERDKDGTGCEREAKRLAAEMQIFAIYETKTLPLPAGFAKKGTGKKAKRALVLPPLPSLLVDSISNQYNHFDKVDLSKLPPNEQHFMCRMRGYYSWGDNGARIFEKSEAADRKFNGRTWGDTWNLFRELQQLAGDVTTERGILLDAAFIRLHELPRRGWKSTWLVMDTWLRDPATRDRIARKAAKWRPTVDLRYSSLTWLNALITLRKDHAKLYASCRMTLQAAGVAQDLEEIGDASVAAKGKAGDTPRILEVYDKMAVFFKLDPIAKVGTRTYLTPDDLEEQLKDKFPIMKLLEPKDLESVINGAPAKISKFMDLRIPERSTNGSAHPHA